MEEPPALRDDAAFSERMADLATEMLAKENGIETLDVSVLRRTAWFDVGGLCAHSRDPVLDCLPSGFGAILGPYVLRRTLEDEGVKQDVEDAEILEFPDDPARK